MKKYLIVAPVVAVLGFSLSACGGSSDGSSGGRPTTDQVANAIRSGDDFKSDQGSMSADEKAATDKLVDCVAKVIHDSDISDEGLQYLVDHPNASDDDINSHLSAADQKVGDSDALENAATECVQQVMPSAAASAS